MTKEEGMLNKKISTLVCSLSSCAIEGNELAIELLKIKDKDFDEFLCKCVKHRLLER